MVIKFPRGKLELDPPGRREYDTRYYWALMKILGEALKKLALADVNSILIAYFASDTFEKIAELEKSKEWLFGEEGLSAFKLNIDIEVNLLIKERPFISKN